ncbi:MAG: indole-3-glycerol phosphate synthase TrpC [Calditrichaeota bacterium]|nr:indole-3-glycerol phosphate synthase TrpC [Calditrichota bacterium]
MTILDKIVQTTRAKIAQRKQRLPLSDLRQMAEQAAFPKMPGAFRSQEGLQIIAEIKKASPSRGVIAQDFHPVQIAREYEAGGAAALSVLTDETYFQGHLSHLREVAEEVSCPVLRKDFIIDPYQIYEAAANGARAVLLLAVLLPPEQLRDFLHLAQAVHLDALVEVHDEAELETALRADASMIGINNRNLKTFQVDLNTSLRLVNRLPESIVRVSESGIRGADDLKRLHRAGFDAVLMGESLMRRENRVEFLQKIREDSATKTPGERKKTSP